MSTHTRSLRSGGLAFALAALAACSTTGSPAPRVQDAPPVGPQEGEVRGFVGAGFTAGPGAFLIPAEVDFHIRDDVAIGPRLQLAVDDDVTIFAPTFHAKKLFELTQDGAPSRWRPYAQGGIGLAWLEKDRPRGRDDDDVGLVLQLGGGVEYTLDSDITLSTGIDVNLLPSDLVGEDIYVSFNLVQIGFRF